jgi:polyphosphate kinase
MTRNLESRVEVVVPIDDPQQRKELRTVLDAQLKPNRLQWQMQSDGSYVRSAAEESCQQYLIDLAEQGRLQRRRRRRGYAHLAGRAINGN